MTGLALIPGLPETLFHSHGRDHGGACTPREAGSDRRQTSFHAPWRASPKAAPSPTLDPMDAALKLDDLMLEVGVGLVPLVDANKGGQLLTKVKALRKHLATQLGFLVPSIHITDNLTIKDLEYVDLPARRGDRALGDAP